VSTVYSTYEAKARFSEVLRLVRSGTPVTVTHHGEPVAEIRPIEQKPQTVDERLDELERRRILVRSREPPGPLAAVARRPGALERFLAERDECARHEAL
jgi:prevent-host-death family protein